MNAPRSNPARPLAPAVIADCGSTPLGVFRKAPDLVKPESWPWLADVLSLLRDRILPSPVCRRCVEGGKAGLSASAPLDGTSAVKTTPTPLRSRSEFVCDPGRLTARFPLGVAAEEAGCSGCPSDGADSDPPAFSSTTRELLRPVAAPDASLVLDDRRGVSACGDRDRGDRDARLVASSTDCCSAASRSMTAALTSAHEPHVGDELGPPSPGLPWSASSRRSIRHSRLPSSDWGMMAKFTLPERTLRRRQG